jgi:hypothetical protein
MGNGREIVLPYSTNTSISTLIFVPGNEVADREFFVLPTPEIAYSTGVVSLITP